MFGGVPEFLLSIAEIVFVAKINLYITHTHCLYENYNLSSFLYNTNIFSTLDKDETPKKYK